MSGPLPLPSRLPSPLALVLTVALLLPVAASAQRTTAGQALPTVEAKTAGMTALEGFFDFYWDKATGHLYWVIEKWETEFLYAVGLAAGLGSNPVGLDRGQRGGEWVLIARQVGPKVLLIEPNHRFQAVGGSEAEQRAVTDAFAPSTHWGFDPVARTGERVLVDATDFFLQDTHGAARSLQGAGQGAYRLDRTRSVFYLENTKVFPRNCEIETWLTFTSDRPNPEVQRTAASGNTVTLREHHSLVELPTGYEPRLADPRVSAGSMSVYDYMSPIDHNLEQKWVRRHRIEKKDPRAALSEPVEPIVYYVDPGAPEPIKGALIEGASWWNQAFEAAGFIDGFQVRELPPGADPMDLRYNMIHWTHRQTRGWSYGGSVTDPRTGEILKGNVNLGSLRLRQDALLGEGMNPVYAGLGAPSPLWSLAEIEAAGGPDFGYLDTLDPTVDPVEMALARVRQLSAHEVGHTLGFGHNYMASTYGGRASVMDYPAPLVRVLPDGRVDLSEAYAVGIGVFDAFVVKYTYSDFPDEADEAAELERIIREGLRAGMRFAADAEATGSGAAHPYAAQWDNGADLVDHLAVEYAVRQAGLARFGEHNIRVGEPLAALQEVLVPLYLHHRYQLEAASHSLGGADYNYALRGDGQFPIRIVAPAKQRQALRLMLESLRPDFLALPEPILGLIPPRAFGMVSGETLGGRTGRTLDPLALAAGAADLTLGFLLAPQRMARLVEYHVRDERNPGLEEVVDALLEATWYNLPPSNTYQAAIQGEVRQLVLERMKQEAASAANPPLVRAVLTDKLYELYDRIMMDEQLTPLERLAVDDLDRWFRRSEELVQPTRVPGLPPGSPIGTVPPPVVPPIPPGM
jgi:hypothetical protein